ncbi:hypothetical protein [Streptomyces sp. SGAir0957]
MPSIGNGRNKGNGSTNSVVDLQPVLDRLAQIGNDVATLAQQVANQQHAIDQNQRQANAAITDGLNRLSTELATINSGLNRLQSAARAAQLAPTAEGDPELGSDTLLAAAGIAHATIRAHRDTWAFLIQVAGNTRHFHIPGKVKDHDGFVSVRLSGPSLVAAIVSLHRARADADDPVTKAIAQRIQSKITAAVEAVTDTAGGTPVRIVIDDRPEDDNGAVAVKTVRKRTAA